MSLHNKETNKQIKMNVEGITEYRREAFCKEGKKNMRKLREAEERDREQTGDRESGTAGQ